MARYAIYTVDSDTPMYLDDLESGSISNDNFHKCLELYSNHVPPWYRPADSQRFDAIPDQLQSREQLFLNKKELMDLNRWVQKRGRRRHIDAHNRIAIEIGKNDEQTVETKTRSAFLEYLENDPVPAMRSLQNSLEGVDQDTSSLLLSVAYPSTMPFLSQELRQWLARDQDHNKEFTDEECREFLQLVGGVRTKLGDLPAVEVEKVAFVWSCEREMIDLKDPNIKVPKGLRHVGAGAAGFIYVIMEPRRQIAIKRIPVVPNLDRYGLFREIRHSCLLSKKSPELFVQFFGWNENEQNIMFSMEYIEFGDLNQLLKKKKKKNTLAESDTRNITRQILQALKIMHEAEMAHRDLKPENILVVSKEPGNIRIKVCDFGISKRLSVRGTTLYRTYCGTRAYKAPEITGMIKEGGNTTLSDARSTFQYLASKIKTFYRRYSGSYEHQPAGSYTEKVDLWSLGCIIFKMVRGDDLNDTGTTPNRKRTDDFRHKLDSMGLEPHGIEFVKELIQYDGTKRPSAAEALRNKWVSGSLERSISEVESTSTASGRTRQSGQPRASL